MKQLFLLLFLLQFQAFAVFAIKDLRVEPAFAKPGEEMTIYFTMVHDYNKFISIGGMLSEDNTWEMSDRLFLCNGNAGKLPKENPTDWELSNLYMSPNQEYIGWYEYSWKFIVPTDLSEGDIFYLILRPDQANQPTVKNLSSALETSIKVEVSQSKAVVYNTATMGEKKATGSYIITEGLPKADLKATPSAGIGGTYTFSTPNLAVALETNSVPGAQIFYTRGSTPVDITDINQLYNNATPVTLSGDDTINAIAVVPGFANKKASWYYTQELPEAKLFAKPSVKIPGIYTFSTVELPVELGLMSEGDTVAEGTGYEIYYTLHNKKPVPGNSDTKKYTGAIALKSSDTIRAVAVSENYKTVPEGKWYYEQDLPDAYIVATPSAVAPSTYDFTTSALVVNLGVIGGGDSLSTDKVKIYYTHGNKQPQIGSAHTKLYTASSPVTVTGDDTIRAIALADGFDEIPEGMWYYNQDLPKAKLEATPGSSGVYVYNSSKLDVTLSTDVGNTIYYTLNGSEPDLNSSSIYERGVVKIFGDQTVKAIALGDGFRQADSTWIYESQLPKMHLRADAGKESPQDTLGFYFDTTVSLVALDESGEEIGDAEIYYLFDYKGTKGQISDGDIPYTGTFAIDSTVTVRALALHSEYQSATAEWNYKLLKKENWLKAFSSDSSYLGDSIILGDSIVAPDDTMHFGYELDVVLETAADSLHYSTGGSSKVYVKGDTIHITKSDPDTVRIEVSSFGHGYKTIEQQLVLVRDTVAVLSVDPLGHKFTNDFTAVLSLSGSWRNSHIYYDLGDGEKVYRKPLHIEHTCQLKARARADFAVDAPYIVEAYVKALSVQVASYRDSDGDGAIDKLEMVFNDSLPTLPDSVFVSSPFSKDETVVVVGERLSRKGEKGVVASFDTPFDFTGSTFFTPAPLARVVGDQFVDASFDVCDSVAPVVVEAIYAPGEITKVNPVERDDDYLTVRFSESVTIEDEGKPFFLRRGAGEYYLRFNNMSSDNDEFRFRVKSIHGVDYPEKGDSIHIDISAKVSANGVVQGVEENRYVPLQVLDIPYRLLIQALSPVNPTTAEIPESLRSEHYDGESGLLIVADFLMLMESDEQDGRITILDKVGNVIIALEGKSANGEHLTCDVLQDAHTRVVFYWDGKNSLGRNVGSGEYIANVSVFDGRDRWMESRISLGVIRDKK